MLRFARLLEAVDVPYMITGSVAGILHGFPRATQDLDIVIDPTADALGRLLAAIPEDRAYVSGEAARDAMRQRGMFNVIEFESGWKIDLIVCKDRAYSREAFGRAVIRTAGGEGVRVVSPEDLILAKLEWARDGESGRQLEDVAALIRVLKDQLDWPYLNRWVTTLGVTDAWKAVGQA